MSTIDTLFQRLGKPEALMMAVATGGDAEAPSLTSNAHIHLPPNFSAFDNVAQAVGLAAQQNVDILGASNYYDYAVYSEFARLASEQGIFPLFGLEIITLVEELLKDGIKINDPGNPGKFYICGKGITQFESMTPEAEVLLSVIRKNDSERMERMAARLSEVFAAAGLDASLDAAAIRQKVALRHNCPVETVYLQERHLAQAFQELLFENVPVAERAAFLERVFGAPTKAQPEDAATIQGEIRSHLMKAGKPAFVEETFVGFDHAYRLVLALGGIPVYPTLADGANPICGYEDPANDLIARIKERGVYGAELIPVRNSPETLAEYVRGMRAAGLFVTAGTEHNTPDLIPIEPTALKGQAIPDDVRAIFEEGACVVAAHQYLTLHGRSGFVDAEGKLSDAYDSDDERIKAFARLGAAVIRRFRGQSIASS